MASEIRVNQIQSRTGVSTISFTETGPIISGVTTITGDLDVTGLVSYDDVTNIDSVGVVTARDGLQVTGGRLLVGNTSSIASLADSKIEAVSGAGAEIHLARNDSSVTDGNAIGILRFYGNDGGTYQECARINCQADGTHANGDKPSRLTFYTTPSGAQTSAERLRITSDGAIAVGDASQMGSNYARISIDCQGRDVLTDVTDITKYGLGFHNDPNTNDANGIGFFNDDGTNCGGYILHQDKGSNNLGDLIFGTSATSNNPIERLRITSAGNIGIGINNPAYELEVASSDTTTFNITAGGNTNLSRLFFSDDDAVARGYLNYDHQVDNLLIATAGSERLRINSSGNLGVNKTPETDWSGSYRAIEIGNSSVSAYQGNTYPSIELNMNCRGTQASYGLGWKYILGMRATQIHLPYSGETIFRRTTSGSADGAITWSESMRISSNGEVTKPAQPLAIIGTTVNNYTPSAGDTLQFDYSNTNRGNHYNTSNYTFTCPVAGDYMVILRLSRKGWCGDLELAKNNSQYVRLELRETGRNNSNNADWQAWCYDFIVPCAANDTLKWKAPSVYTGTGGGNYLLDGYNHIYYDSVTYYLMG